MSNAAKERKGPKKSNLLSAALLQSPALTWDQRRRRARRAAKALLETVTAPRDIYATCCTDKRSACHHFVGIETEWAQRLLGLLAPLVGYLHETGNREDATVDEEASEMTLKALLEMVREINLHIGGAPRFPLHYPLIDGEDRQWALSKKKAA